MRPRRSCWRAAARWATGVVLAMAHAAGSAAGVGAAPAAAGEVGGFDQGRALYEGRHPALSATLRGGPSSGLAAPQAACVNCHRPSGLGSFEGEVAVPPIAAGLLARPFDPATTRRYGAAPRGGPGHEALRVRPAYDAAALHRLLTEGIAPDGRAIGPLMPTYRLDPSHSAALLGFLNGLGAQAAPGVDEGVVHFATITSEDVPPREAQELVHLLRQFFARKNAQTRGEEQRRAAAIRTEHTMYARYRRWELHHWVLRGSPDTWAQQLQGFYAARPVFAVLSGRSEGDWSPVHRFCEAKRLPCLFPITAWPAAEAGFYTAYFSGGAAGQARWLAASEEAASHPPTTVQPWLVLAGETPGERVHADTVAASLRAGLGRADGVVVGSRWQGEAVVVSALPARQVASVIAQSPAASAAARAQVFLLAGAAPPAREPLPWPPGVTPRWVAQQDADPVRLARARAWWRAQGIRPADEAQAALVLFAATAAVESLVHVDERFSREYCLEKLEHNLENMPPMTGYPRLSLGPNQRFAGKQVWLVPAP